MKKIHMHSHTTEDEWFALKINNTTFCYFQFTFSRNHIFVHTNSHTHIYMYAYIHNYLEFNDCTETLLKVQVKKLINMNIIIRYQMLRPKPC